MGSIVETHMKEEVFQRVPLRGCTFFFFLVFSQEILDFLVARCERGLSEFFIFSLG